MRMIMLSALLALGVGFAGASAASAGELSTLLKAGPANASTVEMSARTCRSYRHCWWRHGHKHCEWHRRCWG